MAEILDEINEELRKERFERFWKENGRFIIVCIIAVILTVGARSWWAHYSVERDMQRTSDLIAAVNTQDRERLQTYIDETRGSQQMVAEIFRAGQADLPPQVAAEYYREIAQNRKYPGLYRDMAALLAVGKASESADADHGALLEELEPLTHRRNPFAASALELRAFIHAGRNDYAAALADIDRIMDMDSERAPDDFKARMQILRDYYETQRADQG